MNGENGLSLLVQKFKFKETSQPPKLMFYPARP